MKQPRQADVIIVGGGIAGLSAAIYLGRAKRETLVIDNGKSMARWEPDVQNYLGFPECISGDELLRRARRQARRYHVKFVRDEIISAHSSPRHFRLRGRKGNYSCRLDNSFFINPNSRPVCPFTEVFSCALRIR